MLHCAGQVGVDELRGEEPQHGVQQALRVADTCHLWGSGDNLNMACAETNSSQTLNNNNHQVNVEEGKVVYIK